MSDLATFLRDWIHETPLCLCDRGADTCPDWPLAHALAEAIDELDSPLAGITKQRLLDQTRRQAELVERYR